MLNKFSYLVCTWFQYLYINSKGTLDCILTLIKNLLTFALAHQGKIGSSALANIQNSKFSISFMICEKLRSPTRATFKKSNFQSFCELGRSSKCKLRSTFKNPDFESKDELRKAISEYEFQCGIYSL